MKRIDLSHPFFGTKTIRWETFGRVYRSSGQSFGLKGILTASYTYEEAVAFLEKDQKRGDTTIAYEVD